MNALVEQLGEDLLARAAGQGPDEITIDAGCHRLANGAPAEQLPPDVTVGDRPDHTPTGIVGKQDAKLVEVELPECLFDRFGLSDGNEGPIQQFFGSKGADPALVEG